MYLNKQNSEYTSGPKYAKILNMSKLWIWQCSKYANVTQRSECARICLDKVLNISWVQDPEYARDTQGFKYVWICIKMAEKVWIFDRQGSEYLSHNT